MSSVYVTKTNEYEVEKSLRRIFDYYETDFGSKIVAIKLNLCSLRPRETGTTSDPLVVEQMVRVLNDRGASVRLIEADSTEADVDVIFDCLGFRELEKRYDVKCVNISKEDYVRKKIDGYYFKSIKVPKSIDKADYFISHPKLKPHLKLFLTATLKNQFGCIMLANKSIFHPHINEVIADVNMAFRPDLSIMDAIIAMVEYGPTVGFPQRLNILAASKDPVALDCFGAKILGLSPNSIKYIRLAFEKGLGDMNYYVMGDNVDLPIAKKKHSGIVPALLRPFISF